MTTTNTWTREWPTEPGMYWLYGWRTDNRDHPPGQFFVRAHRTGDVSITCVAEGAFMYQSEDSAGLWRKIKTLDPPTDEEMKAP